MIEISQILHGLGRPGKTKSGLADFLGLRNSAVTEIISGERQIKADEVPLIVEYLDLDQVPIMGRVGAGGDIEPGFEQVPPDGLGTVRVPLWVPEDLVAFQIAGESMLPFYRDKDVIIVWKEQRRPLESFYGEEAAVLTKDGKRYLKTIAQGKSRSVVTLTSWNAKPIENVKLEWIGEIYLTIRASQLARLAARKPQKRGGRR